MGLVEVFGVGFVTGGVNIGKNCLGLGRREVRPCPFFAKRDTTSCPFEKYDPAFPGVWAVKGEGMEWNRGDMDEVVKALRELKPR